MKSSPPAPDRQKEIFSRQLKGALFFYGPEVVNTIIEAGLSAIVAYLRETRGDRAAFETMSRYADAAIEPALQARSSTRETR